MKVKKQPNSVLGIAFDGRNLQGAVVRKLRDGIKLERSATIHLSFDPLTNDPELAGREVRQQLDQAGLTEKRCVVGLPLEWALSSLVKLPDLEGENLSGFLRLQTEKAFPFLIEDLSISVSLLAGGEADQHALLTAVPKKHLDLLGKTLRAAGLQPVSFSLAIQALRQSQATALEPSLALMVNMDGIALLVGLREGVACLRSLNDAFLGDDPVKALNGPAIARELRVTLGQLPSALRSELKRVSIYGSRELAAALAGEIAPRAAALGLEVEVVPDLMVNGAPVAFPFTGSVPPAVALGARYLSGKAKCLEYLPPHVGPWERFIERLQSKKTGLLGGGAAVLILTIALAFLWQARVLANLESRWAEMAPRVTRLDQTQASIRTFRSWYDTSQPSLRIMRALTSAFPEDGTVTAKTLEIRGLSEVSCTGSARSNAALFEALDRLRANSNVKELKTENVRGQGTLQFAFTFKWEEGAAHVD